MPYFCEPIPVQVGLYESEFEVERAEHIRNVPFSIPASTASKISSLYF